MGHLTMKSAALLREYVHLPKPIMAVQISEANAKDVALMISGKLYPGDKIAPLRIYFACCNGRQKAEWGDWIVKDSRGFHSMTDHEFTTTYQEKS